MKQIAIVWVLLLAVFFTQPSASIVLDNDVDVSWSDQGQVCPQPIVEVCQVEVIGAPRLIRNTSETLDRLRIAFHFNGEVISPDRLSLQIRVSDETGKLLLRPDNPKFPVLLTHFQQSPFQEVSLRDFSLANFPPIPVEELFAQLPPDLILTISGSVTGTNHNQYSGGPVGRITLNGAGAQILIDRVGDDTFHRRNALDVPPRSMPVVRALGELELAGGRRGVDLDNGGRRTDRAVGFTHAFDLPPGARILGGTLRLHIVSEEPRSASNLLLLDRGVRSVIAGKSVVPVTPLKSLAHPPVPSTSSVEFVVDLRAAPILFRDLSPGHPATPAPIVANMLGDLDDARLDAILVGNISVDHSDLSVTFHDPREDEVPE